MELSVYSYRDYKAYLNKVIKLRPRSFRKALAHAISCQTAYVSHVLNGNAHLSSEQAEAASRFLGLSRAETRFFLLLVEYTRAGTESLRSLLREELDEVRNRELVIREKVSVYLQACRARTRPSTIRAGNTQTFTSH